ncbi:MAG TPA: GNAT family N-acetyltransferase [Bacillota bacterium]|nr:GNAT family N-acetyltransferase [Bacillota bacterium]
MRVSSHINSSITIRPITMQDFESVLKWSKDDIFCAANDWEKNRGEQELYTWWDFCVHHPHKDFIRLGITLENDLIGYGDIVVLKEDKAELGIAIGERSRWGQGIGTRAMMCLMDVAKSHLHMTTFQAETHESNHRAQKMLEKVGFKEISRVGTEIYMGGECGLVQYSLSII